MPTLQGDQRARETEKMWTEDKGGGSWWEQKEKQREWVKHGFHWLWLWLWKIPLLMLLKRMKEPGTNGSHL
jgi:hypothetical protein